MLSIKEIGRRGRFAIAFLALVLIALLLAKAPPTSSSSMASLPSGKAPGPQMAAPSGSGSTAAADTSQIPGATGAPGSVVIGHSIKNDVSLPLRDIKAVEPIGPQGEGPENRDVPQNYPKGHVKDTTVQDWFGALAMPTPSVSFEGIANMCGCYPPDTQGDVGPNHYVQWVNSHFQILDKTGTSLYGPVACNTLWAGFGGVCQTSNSGDPITLYDPLADRWFMSQFTTSAPFNQCIAVSTSPDPLGTWNRYAFQVSATLLNDYPHFGVWPDGYYMTANRFLGNNYDSPAAIAFDRTRMLAGQPATMQLFNPGNYFYGILPADLDGSTPPPAGAPNYFGTSAGTANSFRLWRFHVDWTTPANSTFTGPLNLTMAPFDPNLCNGSRNCVPQPGTAVGLDTGSGKSMFRLAYRNFGNHESLVTNQSVDVDGNDHAGIRWYEIRDPGGAPYIYQQGTYAPDANHRWMGSIAMDRSGNMALGYSVSSSTVYPSIRYTGRLATDPLGTMPQGEAEIIAGTGSQTGTGYRWGDYSDMTVDPSDDCTFWYTNEYIQTTGGSSWRTHVGAFKFPSCGQPPPPTPTGTQPTATRTTTPPPPTPTACGSYTYITSTATIDPGTIDLGNHCDDCVTYITMPFPIRLYGQSFTNAYVSSNGNVQFNSSDNAFGNACLSVPIFEYTVSPYWDDLYTGDTAGGQGVFASVTGSAPNRIYNLEWRANLCCTNGIASTFEASFHESGGAVDLTYGALAQAGTGQTVGLQRDTSGFTQYSCNTASLSNGLRITFNPPACYNSTPTPSPTPCAISFVDVHPTDYFYEAVTYLYCHGAISGYGTYFLPNNLTTRGQLTKIVVLAEGFTIYTPPSPTFTDVPATHTFYQYIETAYHMGILSGYSCGSGCLEFRPGSNVTRAQLCKIIVNAEGWMMYVPPSPTFQDVPDTHPFYQFIETAYHYAIISGYSCGSGCLVFAPDNSATRGQISKIVYNAVTVP